MAKSTQKKSDPSLTRNFAKLEKRLESLESAHRAEVSTLTARVTALENRVLELERRDMIALEADGSVSFPDAEFFFRETPTWRKDPPPVKRGRRPRIPTEAFIKRRDGLLQFLEVRWARLKSAMDEPGSLERLLAEIKLASPGAEGTWRYRHLTEHIAILWEFLNSGRYSGETRQIADAMAGVPEMKWRSSLDLGTKTPSNHVTERRE